MNAYTLNHYAEKLTAAAAEAKRLAEEIEALPSPIGDAIGGVVAMLARHGLCVISRAALQDVGDFLNEMEKEGEEWPAGMYASVAAVHETLERTI